MAKESGNGWRKRILIGIGVLVILLAEIGVAYLLNKNMVVPEYVSSFGAARTSSPPEQPAAISEMVSPEADSAGTHAQSTPANGGINRPSPAVFNSNIYMIDNVIINPAGSQGGRYVAMSLGLGVQDGKVLTELENRDIQIRDAIIALLSQKTLGKFVAIEERLKLKQEILDLVNHKLNTNKIESIYFTEYVIQ